MNRRNFLKFLGQATAGAGIVYSFPSIIIPKNIAEIEEVTGFADAIEKGYKFSGFSSELNAITLKEIYPQLIRNNFFIDSPFLSYIRKEANVQFSGNRISSF